MNLQRITASLSSTEPFKAPTQQTDVAVSKADFGFTHVSATKLRYQCSVPAWKKNALWWYTLANTAASNREYVQKFQTALAKRWRRKIRTSRTKWVKSWMGSSLFYNRFSFRAPICWPEKPIRVISPKRMQTSSVQRQRCGTHHTDQRRPRQSPVCQKPLSNISQLLGVGLHLLTIVWYACIKTTEG